jgi:hypothetical protein
LPPLMRGIPLPSRSSTAQNKLESYAPLVLHLLTRASMGLGA